MEWILWIGGGACLLVVLFILAWINADHSGVGR